MNFHTPGPWKVKKDAEFSASSDFPWIVLTTAPCGPCDPNVVASRIGEANACLIAAAPDMLEVLETIENDGNQVPDWLWQRIQAAVAKAKGTVPRSDEEKSA